MPHQCLQGIMNSFPPEKKELAELCPPSPKTNNPEITADKTVNDVLDEKAIKWNFSPGRHLSFISTAVCRESPLLCSASMVVL